MLTSSIVLNTLEATLTSNYFVISVVLAFFVVTITLGIMVIKGYLSPAAFFGILGILLVLFICMGYFELQDNYQSLDPQCPHCGAENAFGDDYCSSCGVSLTADTEEPNTCSKCGETIRPGERFCPHCGSYQVGETAPIATCGSCGESISEGSAFCSHCGEPQK